MTRGQTARLKAAFLAEFAKIGIVTAAANAVGIERRLVYRWQESDEQFVLDFRAAEIASTEVMEQEAHRRAVLGTVKPVYQGGKQVGTVHEYSDVLLIFMLKARNPAKYRDLPRQPSDDDRQADPLTIVIQEPA